jgi:predicted HicB family RNase H-like nuclease
MEFTTDAVFDALQNPLTLVEDPAQRQAFERYVDAARFPLERAVFDLLAGFTEDVGQQVADHYRVRLTYRAGAVGLEVDAKGAHEQLAPAEADWSLAEGETEKITIRIPAGLKDLVTQAAADAGVSVNTWFIRMLVGALRSSLRGTDDTEHRHHTHERRDRGTRLSGWIGNE